MQQQNAAHDGQTDAGASRFPAARFLDFVEWMAERLPRRNIEMLLLSEYFGYTMQEIADTLGYTVPAVKSVLFRTRELLRRLKYETEGEERKVDRIGCGALVTCYFTGTAQCIWMEL